jgi:hypothetical protein
LLVMKGFFAPFLLRAPNEDNGWIGRGSFNTCTLSWSCDARLDTACTCDGHLSWTDRRPEQENLWTAAMILVMQFDKLHYVRKLKLSIRSARCRR